MQAKIPLYIGEAREGDERLVWSSWKMSALDNPKNHALYADRPGEHFTKYNRLVHEVMAQDGAHVLMAREPTDPTFLYGWIAFVTRSSTFALTYAYTKYKFRRLNIASALKDAALCYATEGADRIYCADTDHNATFERWGFAYRPIDELLAPKRRRTA